MRTRVVGLVLGLGVVALGGCKAELSGSDNPADPTVDAPSSTDDASDPATDGDVPLGPWSALAPISNASSPTVNEDDAVLAPSGLELYFAMSEGDGTKHLYRMTRGGPTEPWSLPERLGNDINVTGENDQTPRLSDNGKTLYFSSTRDGVGDVDIYTATRQTPNDAFSGVAILPTVNTTGIDRWYQTCADGRAFFLSARDGDDDEDLYEAAPGMAAAAIPISSVNNERGLTVTPDCLTMYFGSDQGGAGFQLYTSTRGSVAEPWPEETPFTELAVMGAQHEDPFLAADGRTFIVTVVVGDNKDLYVATR